MTEIAYDYGDEYAFWEDTKCIIPQITHDIRPRGNQANNKETKSACTIVWAVNQIIRLFGLDLTTKQTNTLYIDAVHYCEKYGYVIGSWWWVPTAVDHVRKRWNEIACKTFNKEQVFSKRLLWDNDEIKEALEIIEKMPKTKFDQTVELHVKLGVDSKHADQQVRGTVVLPNGTGKTQRVLVFAKGPKAEEAEKAGADFVGAEELIPKIQNENWFDYDVIIAGMGWTEEREKSYDFTTPYYIRETVVTCKEGSDLEGITGLSQFAGKNITATTQLSTVWVEDINEIPDVTPGANYETTSECFMAVKNEKELNKSKTYDDMIRYVRESIIHNEKLKNKLKNKY